MKGEGLLRRREEEGGSSPEVAWGQGAPENGSGKDRGEQSISCFGGLFILSKPLIVGPLNSKFDLKHQTSLYLIRVNNGGKNKDPKVSPCLFIFPTQQ